MSKTKNYRILILSASVGAGHVRAGNAIKGSLETLLPNATIKHIDVLETTNKVFRKIYSDGYFAMVKHFPHWIRKIYDKLDNAADNSIDKKVRIALYRANFKKLIAILKEDWDIVINTHFLAPELISYLQQHDEQLSNLSQISVITDFDVHKLWFNGTNQSYFVSNTEARNYLISLGVLADNVHATGIPIDPVFTKKKDYDICLKKHGFVDNLPIVLMIGSRIDSDSNLKIYESLQKVKTPIQLCVIAGKDAKFKSDLESIKKHHFTKIIGFTHEIDELMTIADVVITKPGGLTSSELLVKGCPMIIINPIPGQEEHNTQYLLQNGCAIKPFHPETISSELERLLLDKSALKNMKISSKRHGKPYSARHVVEKCLQILTTEKSKT